MSSAISSITATKPATLFDLQTGMITPRFKHQMDLVGLAVKQFFTEHPAEHVINVNELLQTNGCFQKDCDFYKKGLTSNFVITYQQAAAFLDDDYKDREMVMPRKNEVANAIFPCGVEATMHKRFHSLQVSLNQGFKYDKLHFIVKDAKDKVEAEKLINGPYQEMLKGININIVVADTELNIFEEGLKKLAATQLIGKNYVIITDPTFAAKVEMIAAPKLPGKECLGIASAPIKDWKVDMNLYGYEKALNSEEKAAIAWASAAWNFKARQVNTEMGAYKTTAVA